MLCQHLVSELATRAMERNGGSLVMSSSVQLCSTHSATVDMNVSDEQIHKVLLALQPVVAMAFVKQTA